MTGWFNGPHLNIYKLNQTCFTIIRAYQCTTKIYSNQTSEKEGGKKDARSWRKIHSLTIPYMNSNRVQTSSSHYYASWILHFPAQQNEQRLMVLSNLVRHQPWIVIHLSKHSLKVNKLHENIRIGYSPKECLWKNGDLRTMNTVQKMDIINILIQKVNFRPKEDEYSNSIGCYLKNLPKKVETPKKISTLSGEGIF